jgi:hypothetical protein
VIQLVQSIKINLELIESMIYYWKATSEKQKVGEPYIYALVSNPLMNPLYDQDFTPEGARKVLSAISNREIFKPETKAEGRFWNNQMWMMEDLSVMDAMAAPLKKLNLDRLLPALDTVSEIEQLEVVFLPGHLDTAYKSGHRLFVNFFKVSGDLDGNAPEIDGTPLKDYLFTKLKEMIETPLA